MAILSWTFCVCNKTNYRSMKKYLSILLLFAISIAVQAQKHVLTYKIFDEINNATWIATQGAFRQAETDNADCVIIHLNTYGGEVVYADSIRTRILNAKQPVYVFIDNNAASAGSLISIACDSIYMRKGGNIGAASVVNQTGEKMPDKYQSYMRSTMRSTAEAHGKRSDDTTRWLRDPHIAEAMVDEFITIENVVDSGRILTFTADEAIANGFCEGKMESIEEVAHRVAGADCIITEYRPTAVDNVKGVLGGTFFRSILILIIIGGIYFELQTPGLGVPSIAAIIAALLYFVPLFIDGLADSWEIWLFVIGVLLLVAEIFVIPGFGIAGISGIVCMVLGLAFSVLNNDGLDFSMVDNGLILRTIFFITLTLVVAFVGVLLASHYLFNTERAKTSVVVLQADQMGYVGTDTTANSLIGTEGEALTDLRPSGKILVDGQMLDAISDGNFIEKGSKIQIKSATESQAVVSKV